MVTGLRDLGFPPEGAIACMTAEPRCPGHPFLHARLTAFGASKQAQAQRIHRIHMRAPANGVPSTMMLSARYERADMNIERGRKKVTFDGR